MNTVMSKDGTRIAFDKKGDGPALIVVDGALCRRAFGPSSAIADQLAPNFTVYTYDRRGRGDSGDNRPYAIEREIEDLEAVINASGGAAVVLGISSGAALAAEAAATGVPMQKLALYEAPFIVDNSRTPLPDGFIQNLDGAVAANRPGDAVKMFMKLVGMPSIAIAAMRLMPAWKKLTAVAHTIAYDMRIVGDYQRGVPLPRTKWIGATVPTLVMAGGKSPEWMKNAMRQFADVLPNARLLTLDKQTHMVKPKVLGPELVKFFGSPA